MRNRKKRYYSPLILLFAIAIMVAGGVDTTIAWLSDQTEAVENTFTYGDINITLEETVVDEDGNPVDENGDGVYEKTTEGNEYKMVPGESYLKDPAVTVAEGNEACWVFVKLVEEGGVTVDNGDGTTTTYGFDQYLTYDIAAGWTQLNDAEGNPIEGVFYRFVDENAGEEFYVLKDNTISVQQGVTKEMLNALDDNGQDKENATYPKLSVTAYAVQYAGFEIDEEANVTEDKAALNAWMVVTGTQTDTEAGDSTAEGGTSQPEAGENEGTGEGTGAGTEGETGGDAGTSEGVDPIE